MLNYQRVTVSSVLNMAFGSMERVLHRSHALSEDSEDLKFGSMPWLQNRAQTAFVAATVNMTDNRY
jgi:hypothetical protein